MILAEESPVAQNAPAVDSIPKRLIASSLTRGGELERPGRPEKESVERDDAGEREQVEDVRR